MPLVVAVCKTRVSSMPVSKAWALPVTASGEAARTPVDSSRHRASNILNMRIFIDSSSFPARGTAPRARCVLGLGVLGHGGLVDLQLRRLQGQERLPFQHFWYFCAMNASLCQVVYKSTCERRLAFPKRAKG